MACVEFQFEYDAASVSSASSAVKSSAPLTGWQARDLRTSCVLSARAVCVCRRIGREWTYTSALEWELDCAGGARLMRHTDEHAPGRGGRQRRTAHVLLGFWVLPRTGTGV